MSISIEGINSSWTTEKVGDMKHNGDYVNRAPVEWQQWLRHARPHPPQPEDILLNEAMRMRTAQRSMDSDRKHLNWKREVRRNFTDQQ